MALVMTTGYDIGPRGKSALEKHCYIMLRHSDMLEAVEQDDLISSILKQRL